MNEKKYLSVSEFTRILKNNLENSFSSVYIKGEISNFRPSSSGHWYLVLKDDRASVKAIVFKNCQSRIIGILKSNGLTCLKDGQEIIAEGKISVYEKSGEYSIIINSIVPLGAGELMAKFQLLKEKLLNEGLFDQAHKKILPRFPEHIGIITSPTGAALQDILNVLNRRFAGIRITVFPVSVQGDNAKNEIEQAVKFADYNYIHNTKYKTDVIIIARGGGSIEDLWPFNEENVAYAVYNAKVPVITGIGHEVDFTIADFCADLRAPTPSAAAEIVVRDTEVLINSMTSDKLRMQLAVNNLIDRFKQRIKRCNSEKLFFYFEKIYNKGFENFSLLKDKMINAAFDRFNDIKQHFNILTLKLDAISPLKTVNRGYSLTLDADNKLIKSFDQVKADDEVKIVLAKGTLKAKIAERSDKNYF